ncbi:MAG: CopG family ribbon-helix-helix protein [Candidatus Helarchaeota archaeon]
MPIVSISLSRKILEDLESLEKKRGYLSRSEVIRDAIRSIILEHNISLRNEDIVFALIIVVNDFNREDIDTRLSKLRHEFNELIVEDIHRHIKNQYCIELFLVEGKNSSIIDLIGRIRGIKGLIQVKFVILPFLLQK